MKPLAVVLLMAGLAWTADWSFYGGDAQRTNWEKTDSRITRENVKDFQLVLKRKLENGKGGPRSLTPPAILGQLISYRGFKELAFVSGASDTLWSIDVDTDRIFWEKHFGGAGTCGATATPALTPPTNFGARQRPAPGAPAPAVPAPGGAAPVNRGVLAAGGFGAPRPAFAVSHDGKLHLLNTSNGDDLMPAIPFLPAGAEGSSLTIADGAIYTTTTSCAGTPAGVWALDLSTVDPKNPTEAPPVAASFKAATGGIAIGTDGAVYASAGEKGVAVLAAKTLALKEYLGGMHAADAAPMVVVHKDHELVVAAGTDGALYLFDPQSPAAPVSVTAALGAVSGGISSWQDAAGTRWVLAPVSKAIVAFKLEEQGGKPVLTQAWKSLDIESPQAPVITSGVVFALGSGRHATLHALDGLTGAEIYSTGNQATSPANQTGVTIANGRVYFTTSDGTLYAFGVYMER